jgi:hypothetical protein
MAVDDHIARNPAGAETTCAFLNLRRSREGIWLSSEEMEDSTGPRGAPRRFRTLTGHLQEPYCRPT